MLLRFILVLIAPKGIHAGSGTADLPLLLAS